MRLDGYQRGLASNNLIVDEAIIKIVDMSDAAGAMAAAKMLALPHPPTAIFCATDTQAFGALAAIRERGLTPGIEVSVLGYDGLDFGKHTNPPLTTMAQQQSR